MKPIEILLLLDQLPQDPSNGAARTCKTICEFLASSPKRFRVRALATTATEQNNEFETTSLLNELGINWHHEHGLDQEAVDSSVLSFNQNDVDYTLLETVASPNGVWDIASSKAFERLMEYQIRERKPDIVFTYGGRPQLIRCRRRARSLGAKIVFGLWNHGYYNSKNFFDDVDRIITPSRFLSERYREVMGLETTPLPTPINIQDVVPEQTDPLCLTYVNPTIEKGVMFMARFAQCLGQQRPDVPLMVVESRATAGSLVASGLNGGFDLRAFSNIYVSPGVPRPRDFMAMTRVLLAPSVWQEPAGRVASEALINGIPPIVSDRGGLPEECRRAGVVLPLPDELTPSTRVPVSAEAVQPWIDAALRYIDDEQHYSAASAAARRAGQAYLPEFLAPQYADFFQQIMAE